MTGPRLSRRAMLAAGAVGVTASIGGCTDRLSGSLETFDGSVSVDPTRATDEDAWPVVHGDPANTRSVPADAAPEPPLSVDWTDGYETHVGHPHPVGRDGLVVGSNWDDQLYVIDDGAAAGDADGAIDDADAGSRAWTVSDAAITDAEFEPRTAPIITDESVLIGTRSALWAFDRDDGTERWRTDEPITLGSLSAAPTAAADLAFVRTPRGVAAHDLDTGEREWARPIGLQPTAVPAIRDETVYLGGGDATLHAIDRASGEVRWRVNADGEIQAGPAVTDSGCYVGTRAGTVIAYDHDGTERWRTDVTDDQVDVLAVGNGAVCVATSEDAITVVDPETGERVWRSTEYVSTYANGPVVGDGRIFATVGDAAVGNSSERTIGAFDAETGDLDWEHDEYGLENGPAVIDGALYATGRHDRTSQLTKLS